MIKLFRQIRRNLMESGNSGKYLKYAIGEIFLVMIGILLALQINNWNENRKELKREILNLKNLKAELETTLAELQGDYEQHVRNYNSTLDVYHYIQSKPALVDSMYEDFYNAVRINYFFPKTSTYETLKSGNLEVIRSDSLRELITDVYESGYERILRKVDTRRNAGRLLFPYYQKNFIMKMSPPEVIEGSRYRMDYFAALPNNYSFVINDPEYETLINQAILGRLTVKLDFERSISSVESCVKAINEYLKMAEQ